MILKRGSLLKGLENDLHSLAIINVHSNLSEEESIHIFNVLLKKNTRLIRDKNIYHCLLTGNRSLILTIVEKLYQIYFIEWIGDEYCMLTYIPPHDVDIPIAKVSKQPNGLDVSLSLYGYKILYTQEMTKLQNLITFYHTLKIDTNEFDIICSCNTHNTDNEDTCHPGWQHFMDYSIGSPGLHYFINKGNNTVLDGHSVMFNDFNPTFSLCIIHTPDKRNELENCLTL